MNKRLVFKLLFIFILLFISFEVMQSNKSVFAAQVDGIESGKVYIITNGNSKKCLNVNLGQNTNGVNVIQWTQDGSTEQRWKVVYDSSRDSYKFYPMCSSNGTDKVLDVLRTGGSSSGQLQSGCNVDIWSNNDSAAQEWKITGNLETGYRIWLKSTPDLNLVLTSYNTGNGSGAGTSPTSSGNVFVSTWQNINNQFWYFDKESEYTKLELSNWWLVDSGKHLDWAGSTKYQTQFNSAVNVWNAYKSGIIRQDGSATVKDMDIQDVNDGANGIFGTASPKYLVLPGKISFNTYMIDSINDTSFTQMVCTHELGHALGLADRYTARAVIMFYNNLSKKGLTELTKADKLNYDAAYNRY